MQPLSLSPLLLLLLLLASGASATAVHEVAISVRSVRSVTYLGTQVSIFQHVSTPLRYFFQPLSFFDAESVRLESDEELSVTRLHFDVFMWTDEFLQLVRSHFPSAESVELMPLTQIRLSWSRQAAQWLGDGFNETWRLLDAWKDADKPQMRTTFTVACDTEAACGRLQRRLNGSREVAESLFDLQYWIQGESSYNVSLAVRGAHFLQSKTFERLRNMGEAEVFVDDATVTQLAQEVADIAVVDVHSQERHRIRGERVRIFGSAIDSLQSLLRRRSPHTLTLSQWQSCVLWPRQSLNLRPDRLATALNRIFRFSSGGLIFYPNWTGVLRELKENLLRKDFDTLRRGLDAAHGRVTDKVGVPVQEVEDLVASLDSAVQWKAVRFQAKIPRPLFAIRVDEISKSMRLFVKNVTVSHQVTLHADPLRPLPASADGRHLWQPKFADSFCFLAKDKDPPGMRCQDLAYTVSVRSSIFGLLNLVHINATFSGGSIGRNRLFMPQKSSLEFGLRICCTGR